MEMDRTSKWQLVNNHYYYLAGRSLGNNIPFEGVNAL